MNRDNLLDEISKYGLIFNEETIFNLFVSLKTKPFIILTGISGSGKSKIAELFSLALAENSSQVSLTPVKPNWNDNKGIFGYHNVLEIGRAHV